MDPESPSSPLSVETPMLSNFNTFGSQQPSVTKTFPDHDGSDGSPQRRSSFLDSEELDSFKRQLSSLISKKHSRSNYMKRRLSSVAKGLPSPPGYWSSHDALCDSKDSRDPSLVQEEDNFPPSPSSDRVFANSVIRQVLGTRTIHQTGKSEYLVHWAGYPRGQLSWVSQDIIEPIAEHQIMFFEYERRLLCYKGSRGEMFTRKDAPQCEEADEEGCVGCARCGRGCN
ncbi:hypothetical protein FNAPI_8519 [Fusarium napiforme]|uniref:Chromo domain-containing protein n=1 Tax=Fusarium napiforme TaxID=42672 RepID=A0A8H5J4R6_9HYPO|nr:hypothetical protein FNAPI_8519 [Fusarium napiforme]